MLKEKLIIFSSFYFFDSWIKYIFIISFIFYKIISKYIYNTISDINFVSTNIDADDNDNEYYKVNKINDSFKAIDILFININSLNYLSKFFILINYPLELLYRKSNKYNIPYYIDKIEQYYYYCLKSVFLYIINFKMIKYFINKVKNYLISILIKLVMTFIIDNKKNNSVLKNTNTNTNTNTKQNSFVSSFTLDRAIYNQSILLEKNRSFSDDVNQSTISDNFDSYLD
jgi:hypothetical protein